MKSWQFYSLQSSIMIAIAFAATSPYAKIVFLILAVLYMVTSWVTLYNE